MNNQKQNDNLIDLLKKIASVAHCGGLLGMTETDALVIIRKATLEYFDKNISDDDHCTNIKSITP